MRTIGILTTLLILGLAPSAQATVINFDDLDASVDLPLDSISPYAGMSWSNFSAYTSFPGFDGFNNGIVSPDNAAYSGGQVFGTAVVPVVGSIVSATAFDFTSAYLGAGYYDDLVVTVRGLRGGSVIYSQDVVVGTGGAALFNFAFANIDALEFVASTGANTSDPFGCGDFNCTQFTIDDITVAAATITEPPGGTVPEPSTLALLAASGLFGMARRRRPSTEHVTVV